MEPACTQQQQQQQAPALAASRQKVDKMSAEVVDSNPYSRLMALQRMGIVKDYERIRHCTVGNAEGRGACGHCTVGEAMGKRGMWGCNAGVWEMHERVGGNASGTLRWQCNGVACGRCSWVVGGMWTIGPCSVHTSCIRVVVLGKPPRRTLLCPPPTHLTHRLC